MAKRKKKKKAKRSGKRKSRVAKKVKRKAKRKGKKKAPAKQKKLTERQRRFVEFYMGKAAGNATEAARLAGYKGNRVTLESVGRENLGKPRIRKAIDERVDADPAVANREDRQRFWTTTMNSAKVAMKDRLKASELLGKSQGDFVERHEHGGTISLVDLATSAEEVLAKWAKKQSGS